MSAPKCESCGWTFIVGEPAWARDVHVISPEGVTKIRKYTCFVCEPE